MPIYEYKCLECNKIFEEFIRNSNDLGELLCPNCGSKSIKRIMSSYSAFNASSENLDYGDSGSSCPTCGCDGGSCDV